MYRYTRVLKGALFALLFSLSALLPSYAAITADGPGSGVAGPRETVPEEGAQTEALWQESGFTPSIGDGSGVRL